MSLALFGAQKMVGRVACSLDSNCVPCRIADSHNCLRYCNDGFSGLWRKNLNLPVNFEQLPGNLHADDCYDSISGIKSHT